MQLSTDSLSELILGIFTPPDFCKQIGITSRTYRRWQNDINQVPNTVLLWLDLRGGHLSQLHNDWIGWTVNTRTGELNSPYGFAFSTSQIEHMNMAFNERDLLKSDNRALRKQLLKTRDQTITRDRCSVIPFPNTAK